MPKVPTLTRASNSPIATEAPKIPNRRGPKPRPVVEFPEALLDTWSDPVSFSEAFALHLQRHGDSCWHLHRALLRPGETFDRKTFQQWAAGTKRPNTIMSFEMLARTEHRYRLQSGYFRSKLESSGRAPTRRSRVTTSSSEHRRLAWHLPDNFEDRPTNEQEEILEWVRTVIISGSTVYRRYQAEAMKVRYSLRFPHARRIWCQSAAANRFCK